MRLVKYTGIFATPYSLYTLYSAFAFALVDLGFFFSFCLCLSLSVVLYVYPSIRPSIHLTTYHLLIYLSVCLSKYLSFVHLSHNHLSINTSVHLSIHLAKYLSVCLSVCLSIHPPIHPSLSISLSIFICFHLFSLYSSVFLLPYLPINVPPYFFLSVFKV